MTGDFHLFAMKGGVFAVKGSVFVVKGNLQFLSKREDKSCDFYVYLKNTNYIRKYNLTSQEIAGTRSG